MPRVYHQVPGCADWRTARVCEPLSIPDGLWQSGAAVDERSVLLLPVEHGGVALLCQPGTPVSVNGDRVVGGLRLLEDRDEIRIRESRIYFTTNDPLEVENLPVDAVSCLRCSGRIESGTPAVRCHCGAWFHQNDVLPCFTYGATCPQCGAATGLDTDPWDPSAI